MNKAHNYGAIGAVVGPCIVFLIFLGPTIAHLNTTFFQAKGDGVQSYYNTLFHVKHDTSYMHSNSMNYPYGENAFFTNNFMPISNTIKWISSTIIDISSYTLGIINGLMLGTFVLCSLCLYLLFQQWKLPVWYSVLVGIGLTFLSPQLIRLYGHYLLSFGFVIPFTLLMLTKFYEKVSYKISVYIGLVVLLLSAFSFYFFALIGFIIGLYFLLNKAYRRISFLCTHGLLQLVLPFVIIQLWMYLTNEVTDRTASPWGFFAYNSNLNGVFVPLNQPVAEVIDHLIGIGRCSFEGRAFIGYVADLFFIVLLISGVKYLISKGRVRNQIVFQKEIEGQFFFIGFGALFISFGLPFIIPGLEKGLEYLAVFKQLRAIGRFAWIFFFIINVLAFVFVYRWASTKRKYLRYVLLILSIVVLYHDAFLNFRSVFTVIQNQEHIISDWENELPENKVLNQLLPSIDNYQAIINLPSFHVGSESIWTDINAKSCIGAYRLAMKTGLSISSVHSGRMSLSQTYKNVAMFAEAYRPLKILNDYPNQKPFLMCVVPRACSAAELKIVNKGRFLFDWLGMKLYHLDYQVLQEIGAGLYDESLANIDSNHINPMHLIVKTFNDSINVNALRGQGCYEGVLNGPNVLLDTILRNEKEQDLILSFWMKGVEKDMYPRSNFSIKLFENPAKEEGSELEIYSDWNTLFRYFKTYDKDWVLIEIPLLAIPKGAYRMKVFTVNKVLKNRPIYFDELQVRPKGSDVYFDHPEGIIVNNRLYLKAL